MLSSRIIINVGIAINCTHRAIITPLRHVFQRTANNNAIVRRHHHATIMTQYHRYPALLPQYERHVVLRSRHYTERMQVIAAAGQHLPLLPYGRQLSARQYVGCSNANIVVR